MTLRTRRKSRRRPTPWVIALAVLTLVTAFVAFRSYVSDEQRRAIGRLEQPSEGDRQLADISIAAPASDAPQRTRRVVYRYSVVAGGVLDADEARDATRRDPVVAEHYSDLRVDLLRGRAITKPAVRYMSYRIGPRIYWTRRPVALQKGEIVLDDGVNEVRARCGNLISEEPRTPTYLHEPPPDLFDEIDPSTPVATPQPVPSAQRPEQPYAPAPSISPSPIIVHGERPPGVDSPRVDTGAPIVLFGFPTPDQTSSPPPAATPSLASPADDPNVGGPSVPGGTGGSQVPPIPVALEPPAGPLPIGTVVPIEDSIHPPHDPRRPPFVDYPPRESVSVPEPGTLLLMGVGGAIAALSRRRRG